MLVCLLCQVHAYTCMLIYCVDMYVIMKCLGHTHKERDGSRERETVEAENLLISKVCPSAIQRKLVTCPPPWVVFDVVSHSVQEVSQVKVVVVVVGEAIVDPPVQISVGGPQEKSAPHSVVMKLPHVIQCVCNRYRHVFNFAYDSASLISTANIFTS